MGGASAEISFIPKAGTSVPEQYSKKLKVYGDTYPLYTHSFLCFGLKEAERRLLASLVQVRAIASLFLYFVLAEEPSVAWVLNELSVDAVYPILLLYLPETPVPSLSCRNLLLGSLFCPWHADSC